MIHDFAFGGANNTVNILIEKKHASILVLSNARSAACRPLSAEIFFNATQLVLTTSPCHGAGTLHNPRMSVIFAIPGYSRKKHYLALFITEAFISESFREQVSIEGIVWLLRVPSREFFSN